MVEGRGECGPILDPNLGAVGHELLRHARHPRNAISHRDLRAAPTRARAIEEVDDRRAGFACLLPPGRLADGSERIHGWEKARCPARWSRSKSSSVTAASWASWKSRPTTHTGPRYGKPPSDCGTAGRNGRARTACTRWPSANRDRVRPMRGSGRKKPR